MTLDQINQREDKENASFLKWIKSPSFQLQSHESRTTDLELYMISKNREIGDLQSEIEALRKQVEIANEFLNRLSCLGNGDCRGNSVGNYLAIEAIKKIAEHRLENEI